MSQTGSVIRGTLETNDKSTNYSQAEWQGTDGQDRVNVDNTQKIFNGSYNLQNAYLVCCIKFCQLSASLVAAIGTGTPNTDQWGIFYFKQA